MNGVGVDALRDGWRGPRWRRWAFVAGAVLTLVTTSVVPLVAVALGGDPTSLTLLILALESVALALVGAGLLERLSGRLITGGLTRQPPPEALPEGAPGSKMTDADRERRDRLTIRAGLIVLPVFATFLALLFVS